jgi:hypothetical protein
MMFNGIKKEKKKQLTLVKRTADCQCFHPEEKNHMGFGRDGDGIPKQKD